MQATRERGLAGGRGQPDGRGGGGDKAGEHRAAEQAGGAQPTTRRVRRAVQRWEPDDGGRPQWQHKSGPPRRVDPLLPPRARTHRPYRTLVPTTDTYPPISHLNSVQTRGVYTKHFVSFLILVLDFCLNLHNGLLVF